MCCFTVEKKKNRSDQENSTRKAWVISLAKKEIEGLERETTKVSSKKVSANREFATIRVLSKLDIYINMFSSEMFFLLSKNEVNSFIKPKKKKTIKPEEGN